MFNLSQNIRFLINSLADNLELEILKKEYLKLQNPHELIELSFKHGILPIFYYKVKNHSFIEKEIINEMKFIYESIARKNMQLSSQLIKISRALNKKNIDFIAYKGPTLAFSAYKDITLRQYQDIDLLIKKDDIKKVSLLLSNNNYLYTVKKELLDNETYINSYYNCEFTHKTNKVRAELHWKLFKSNYCDDFTESELFSYVDNVTINKHTIPTFTNEFLLLYLCIHGTKHRWERIEWVFDLHLLVTNNNINWHKLEQLSTNINSKNMLKLGLYMTNKLFGTKINLFEEFDNKIIKLYETTLLLENPNFDTNMSETTYNLNKLKFNILLQENIRLKIKFLFNTFFKISYLDIAAFNIKDKYSYLYFILRPVRLIKKYTKKVFNV